MSNAHMDAQFLRAEIDAILSRYPELFDDDEWRLEVLDAETDMVPLVSRLLKRKLDADTMVSAIKERKAEIAERQARYERQSEGFKSLIKSVMIAADLDKLTLPDATVSITKPRITVEITDLDAIPQGYAKFEKKPDKTAIKAALEAGNEIPGAALGLSDEGLMVRTR